FLSDNFTGGLFIDINQGERHNTLVQNILHGTSLNPNIGLDNPNSYLSRQIANRYSSGYSSTRIIGTADFWAESEMEKFLVNGAENMHFILHFPNGPGGDYYLYSTTVNVDNVNINSWINPVVKTTLRKNAAGIYEPVAAEQGRAKCSYYQQQYTGGVIIRAKSINYGSFQAL
ncbi:MAG: hypothetical protein J6Y43_02945, partial [Clostridia bacterium]|nr:hypothetical protein [Clostridia bacterium]